MTGSIVGKALRQVSAFQSATGSNGLSQRARSPKAAAGRVLPFRRSWQAAARPAGVRLGVFGRDLHDGVVVAPFDRTARPLGRRQRLAAARSAA